MGFGLPAAIGAKIARPDALVIDLDGDASFSMTLSELSTAAQYYIGVKVIIINNEGTSLFKISFFFALSALRTLSIWIGKALSAVLPCLGVLS